MVLATHCIRQIHLHFLFRASACAIIFQLEFTITLQIKALYTLKFRENYHTSEDHHYENFRPDKDVKFVLVNHF
jgi:hypothetical protein